MMDKNEIIERLGEIAKHAVHTIGEEPFIMSLDDGIAIHEAIDIIQQSRSQRTGRWIDHVEDGYVECPFCHSATNCDNNISDLHFCFSCGARMEESEK